MAAISPSLTDPGRVRVVTSARYYMELDSILKWNISFYLKLG